LRAVNHRVFDVRGLKLHALDRGATAEVIAERDGTDVGQRLDENGEAGRKHVTRYGRGIGMHVGMGEGTAANG